MFSMSIYLFSFSSSILFIWSTSGILLVSAQISSSFPKAYPGLLRIHCYLLLLSILDLSIFLVVLPIFNVLFNVLALFVSHIVFVLKFIFLLLIKLYQLPSGQFSWYIFSHDFTFSIFVLFIFKWASNNHNIVSFKKKNSQSLSFNYLVYFHLLSQQYI